MSNEVVEALWGRIDENLYDKFEEARTLNEATLGLKEAAEAAATNAGSAAKAEVDKLKAGAPEAFDTLLEIANELEGNATDRAALTNSIALKADKTQVETELATKAEKSHGHTVSEVTGLQAALNAKAASSHTHTVANVTGLQASLDTKASTSSVDTKLATKAEKTHSHAISEVTGLQTALNAKASTSYVDAELLKKAEKTHGHPISEVTGLQSALDGASKAATWGDLTGKPTTFPPASHGHPISEVTGLQTALNAKAASNHSHSPASLGAAPASHEHTVAHISDLPTITSDATGGALVQRFSDGNITTTLPAGNYNVTPKIYVDRRPALFSGAGSPPTTITGAVVGDWWLDESSMELHKITGV